MPDPETSASSAKSTPAANEITTSDTALSSTDHEIDLTSVEFGENADTIKDLRQESSADNEEAALKEVERTNVNHLVDKAKKGDRTAFAEIVNIYWDRLYRYLYRLTERHQVAEDLAQDTFIKAMEKVDQYKPGTNFRAWLFTIGHNTYRNYTRQTKAGNTPLTEEIPSREIKPESVLEGNETMQRLKEAIEDLPVLFRAALLLRVENDLSFKEIAEVLDTTEETARWRVYKARKELMEKMGPYLDL